MHVVHVVKTPVRRSIAGLLHPAELGLLRHEKFETMPEITVIQSDFLPPHSQNASQCTALFIIGYGCVRMRT